MTLFYLTLCFYYFIFNCSYKTTQTYNSKLYFTIINCFFVIKFRLLNLA